MNDVSLKRKIAAIAADSSRVVILPHAKKRMRNRRILLTQILYCLRHGNVIEPAHLDIKGLLEVHSGNAGFRRPGEGRRGAG